jgi:hypothetical protein
VPTSLVLCKSLMQLWHAVLLMAWYGYGICEVVRCIAVWSVTQARLPLYSLMMYTSSLVVRTEAYE